MLNELSNVLAYRLPRRDSAELIDGIDVSEADLLENLRDLARINRVLGGVSLSAWALGQFVHVPHMPGQHRVPTIVQSLHVLDVGTGYGDIPRSLLRRGVRAPRLDIIATDINPQIVKFAAHAHHGALRFAAANGLHLPFADASLDVVMCSLALHHFAPDAAVALLVEMARVARRGVIFNDIVRSWPGLAGAWLLGRLLSTNRLTRHDGLASVQRAYTPDELRALAQRAGLRMIAMRVLPGYRAVYVGR